MLRFQQKTDTQNKLIQTHDIIADGFNDTYLATKRPTVSLFTLTSWGLNANNNNNNDSWNNDNNKNG